MILQNALVYTPRHTFERGTIIIRDGRIVPFAAPEEGEEVLDAEGLYALPGLVDIHFHGAMGKDFCDGTEEAIQTLADFEASKGVLAICPATMTYPEEILNKVMDAAAAHKNGKGADLVDFFNEDGLGAIVNSSRGIIAAYKNEKYAQYGAENFGDASRAAVMDMVADINGALANK